MASVIVLVICFDGWWIGFWCLFFMLMMVCSICCFFRTFQELSFRFWCLICPSKLNAGLEFLASRNSIDFKATYICGQPMNCSLIWVWFMHVYATNMVRWWRLGIVDVMWKWHRSRTKVSPNNRPRLRQHHHECPQCCWCSTRTFRLGARGTCDWWVLEWCCMMLSYFLGCISCIGCIENILLDMVNVVDTWLKCLLAILKGSNKIWSKLILYIISCQGVWQNHLLGGDKHGSAKDGFTA